MEITSLNEEFFGKCVLKERLGLVTNREGQITFKPKNGGDPIVITDDKMLKRWDKGKFNRKKLKDKVTIIGRLQVNEDAQYIICQHDNLTLNGDPVTKGSIVVKSENELLLYNDLYLFCAEIKSRQTPNLKEAVRVYKATKGQQRTNSFGNVTVNNKPENVIELSARDSGMYLLDAFLVKTSEDGGVYHWGWRLKDSVGKLIELPDAEVKGLVEHGQVKDTILSGDTLKGVNYDIDLLDQDYAS